MHNYLYSVCIMIIIQSPMKGASMEATVIEFEDAKFSHEYSVEASDGYMGATETTGTKFAKQPLYGTDLSKAIRADLRAHLGVTKKSNVNVSIEHASMYQSVCVTIKLERDIFSKPWQDAKAEFIASDASMPVWIGQADEAGYDLETVYIEAYRAMEEADRLIVRERLFNHLCRPLRLGEEAKECHIDRCFLTEEAKRIISQTKAILDAYNHDGSNAQVDYFDRHFYSAIYIKWI